MDGLKMFMLLFATLALAAASGAGTARAEPPGAAIQEQCGEPFGQLRAAQVHDGDRTPPKGGAAAFDGECDGGGDPGGEEPQTPGFQGETATATLRPANAGPEVSLSAASTNSAEYAWEDASYRVTFSYNGTFLNVGVDGPDANTGADVFLSLVPAQSCGAWNLVVIQAEGAAISGATFNGVDAAGATWFQDAAITSGFNLAFDMTVAGWQSAGDVARQASASVGCEAVP